MLKPVIDDMERRRRRLRADALRATRKVDRPLARFMLRRWKNDDVLQSVAEDVLIYGSAWIKAIHPDIREVYLED